jgi:hypothetical protein
MLALARTDAARRDLKLRQHLMERSFARSARFEFDRARWRGLWRVSIQEYLVSTIQNIETLIRYRKNPTRGMALAPLRMPGSFFIWLFEVLIGLSVSFRIRRVQLQFCTPKLSG